jgi:hypothetical protein
MSAEKFFARFHPLLSRAQWEIVYLLRKSWDKWNVGEGRAVYDPPARREERSSEEKRGENCRCETPKTLENLQKLEKVKKFGHEVSSDFGYRRPCQKRIVTWLGNVKWQSSKKRFLEGIAMWIADVMDR